MKSINGPLSGYKILDLSRVLSGPAATMMLADQGADVIKIEPPAGDITRQMGVGDQGMTSGFLNINRGKRGMCLDLGTEQGRHVVREIAATCDVVVQNFRPGTVEALGLGYADLVKVNKTIIFASISGFGESGPYAKKRVYDPIIQALSGLTDIQADSESGRPKMMRTVIPDKVTALTAAQGITAALLQRERTGEGQHLRLAMLDAMIAFLWPEGMINLTVVDEVRDLRIGQLALDLIFQTSDGYITAGAMSDDEWAGMCKTLERPDWVSDPRFSSTSARFENAEVRIRETGKILRKRTSAEWLETLDANGVPCAPVLTRTEMLNNPQVVNNDIIEEYGHPVIGTVRQARGATRFGSTKNHSSPVAPALGQHNAEILKEIGYTDEEISKLRSDKIIYSSD